MVHSPPGFTWICLFEFLEIVVSSTWYFYVLSRASKYLNTCEYIHGTGADGLTVVMAHSAPGFMANSAALLLATLASQLL